MNTKSETVDQMAARGFLSEEEYAMIKAAERAATKAANGATIGNGMVVHTAYRVQGRLVGSACNPYAWQTSRVRPSNLPVTCARCEKAVHRKAQSA